jgi:hypothetical protein
MKRKTKSNKKLDYIKAARKGSREAEYSDETGFTSKHKVHKSKKAYSRKIKYKDDIDE